MGRTTTSTYNYTNLGNNIYQVTNGQGNRYRVRVSIKGTAYDEYFTNKAKRHQVPKSVTQTKGGCVKLISLSNRLRQTAELRSSL